MTATDSGPRQAVFHVDDEVEIGRPRPDVFAFLADPEHLPAWRAGIKRASRTSANIGVGATYRIAGNVRGRPFEATYELTAYQPDESFSGRTRSTSAVRLETFGFEGTDTGTRVTVGVMTRPEGRLARLRPLVRPALRRRIRADLRRVKAMLEGPQRLPEPEPELDPDLDAEPELPRDGLSEDETARP